MHTRRTRILGTVTFACFISSCALFSPAVVLSPVAVRSEEMQNGYLLEIRTHHSVGEVTALVSRPNWLVITVADTLLDTSAVAKYRNSFVDSTEVRRFETATQFSFRFRRHITTVEVLRGPDRESLMFSVFF